MARTKAGAGLAFLEHVLRRPATDECILWPYSVYATGYGMFRKTTAHRAIWIMRHGPTPKGWEVAHMPIVCHNRLCVNPRHLEAKPPAGNNRDMDLDGTRAEGMRNGQTVICPITARKIRSYAAHGMQQRYIADLFELSRASISRVVTRKAWT